MGRPIQSRLHDLITELAAFSVKAERQEAVRRVQLALAMLHAAADELDCIELRVPPEPRAVALPHG
jgi:hypothetical protein